MTRDQVRKYIKPFIFHKDSMKKFYASLCFLTVGKAIGIASPFILKYVVNMMMSVQTATAGASMAIAGSAFSLNRAIGAVGLWGLSRLVTNTFMCFHMDKVTSLIQDGVRRIASASFKHLHNLDLSYHKDSSKNTVFGINRALRSFDQGLRFVLGFAAQMVFEFFFICGTMTFTCGPKYLMNMLITCGLYTILTNKVSKERSKLIKEKMNIDKKQEFY